MKPRPLHSRSGAYLPLYVGDYLRDTQHLSEAEDGVYCRLLMHYWASGEPLPADNKKLAAIARVSLHKWMGRYRQIMLTFFSPNAESWHNRRMDFELARWREQSVNNQKAARIRWDADAMRAHSDGNANAMPPVPVPVPVPVPEVNTRSKTLAANAAGAWEEFWQNYPKKTAKKDALRAWRKVKAEETEALLDALERHKQSDQWQRGVIPHPATWLNARRWEDETSCGTDLGQCMWNINGDHGTQPRCEQEAVEEQDRIRYCQAHRGTFSMRIR